VKDIESKKSLMADIDYDERLGEWDGDDFNGWRFILYEVPGENGWEQLDLPLPNQAQLLAEDAEYQRIADEGVYDSSLDEHLSFSIKIKKPKNTDIVKELSDEDKEPWNAKAKEC